MDAFPSGTVIGGVALFAEGNKNPLKLEHREDYRFSFSPMDECGWPPNGGRGRNGCIVALLQELIPGFSARETTKGIDRHDKTH